MGRRQQLTENERGQIDVLAAQKCTKREMARWIGRSAHAITTYLQDQQQYGKKYKGKRAALTVEDQRRLRLKASNSTLSAVELRIQLDLKASRWTISRTLRASGLRWSKMLKKPLLTKIHKADRLAFCRSHMTRIWRTTWFTDEKKLNLNGPDCTAHSGMI